MKKKQETEKKGNKEREKESYKERENSRMWKGATCSAKNCFNFQPFNQ